MVGISRSLITVKSGIKDKLLALFPFGEDYSPKGNIPGNVYLIDQSFNESSPDFSKVQLIGTLSPNSSRTRVQFKRLPDIKGISADIGNYAVKLVPDNQIVDFLLEGFLSEELAVDLANAVKIKQTPRKERTPEKIASILAEGDNYLVQMENKTSEKLGKLFGTSSVKKLKGSTDKDKELADNNASNANHPTVEVEATEVQ